MISKINRLDNHANAANSIVHLQGMNINGREAKVKHIYKKSIRFYLYPKLNFFFYSYLGVKIVLLLTSQDIITTMVVTTTTTVVNNAHKVTTGVKIETRNPSFTTQKKNVPFFIFFLLYTYIYINVVLFPFFSI